MIKKLYEWLFYLIEHTLTSEKGDYLAKITTQKTKTVEDIADRIVKERTEFRKETIITILGMTNDVKTEFLLQGNSVNDGITIYDPAIKGVFTGETIFDESKHTCTVNVRITNDIQKLFPLVKATYSGLTVDNGGAVIEKVIDSVTESVNEFITPGNAITIIGKKIRVVSKDADDIKSCVVFENEEEGSEFPLESPIITNDPGKVVVMVPSLTPGSYKLTIKTLFSNTSTLLKAPRYITFKMMLTVG